MLEAGVELYEARANAVDLAPPGAKVTPERLTLHTKGVIFDREIIYAGS